MTKKYFLFLNLLLICFSISCATTSSISTVNNSIVTLSNQVVVADTPKQVITTIQYDSIQLKEEYKVALLLPFQTDKIKIDSLGNPEGIPSVSRMAIEFYEGVKLALDSLQQQGINLKLFVYDTEGDTNHLKVILSEPELKNVDLIIGPIYNSEITVAAKFALENKIFMVSPLSSTATKIGSNPFYITSSASMQQHCNALYNQLINQYKPKTIFLLYRDNENEKSLVTDFENAKHNNQTLVSERLQFVKLTDSVSRSISNLQAVLSDTGTNIIIVPSFSETFVYSTTKTLNNISGQKKIVLYGMPTWKDFESLQLGWMDTLHAHISSTTWYPKTDSAIISLSANYETKYQIKPTDYSLQGFEVMQFFGEHLLHYGTNVTLNLSRPVYHTLANRFYYNASTTGAGDAAYFENKFVFILNFEDGKIVVSK